MRWLYDLLFFIFALVSAPKPIRRGLRNPAYKGMLGRRLKGGQPSWVEGHPKLWFNGVSVGEIVSLAPLIRAFERAHPGIRVVITTTTGTGYQRALKLYPQHQVMGYPLDFSWVVSRRLRRFRPHLIVSVELDLWPNFLMACGREKIPYVVVAGRLSESSTRGYAKVSGWIPFENLHAFYGQDEIDASRALEIGLKSSKVSVGGNLKFDLIRTEGPELDPLCSGMAALDEAPLILASTHEPEEAMILDALETLDWKSVETTPSLVMVPRHPERKEALLKSLGEKGWKLRCYSEIESIDQLEKGEVLLVDRIGVLPQLYSFAKIAIVGGSFIPHGGQNMIEPAAMGCVPIYGPHVQNFREASSLLEQEKASFRVKNIEEMRQKLSHLLENSEELVKASARGRSAIQKRQGVAEKYRATLTKNHL